MHFRFSVSGRAWGESLESTRKSVGREFSRFWPFVSHVRDVNADNREVVSTSGLGFRSAAGSIFGIWLLHYQRTSTSGLACTRIYH